MAGPEMDYRNDRIHRQHSLIVRRNHRPCAPSDAGNKNRHAPHAQFIDVPFSDMEDIRAKARNLLRKRATYAGQEEMR